MVIAGRPFPYPGQMWSHSEYSKYVGKQLGGIATEINDQLADENREEIKVSVDNLKKVFINLSKKLEKKIVEIGVKYKGPNIEIIAKLGK